MSFPNKRRNMDVTKLMTKDFTVDLIDGGVDDFYVEFHGPKKSIYEGGVWKIHVHLPDTYPYESPTIEFKTKIFHPNIDDTTGYICLDVINEESWSSAFDLVHVFEFFLPQLLQFPNPIDPVNSDAASLMLDDMEQYKAVVKGHIEKYAKKEDPTDTVAEERDEAVGKEDISDGHSDDNVAGDADTSLSLCLCLSS